MSMMEWIVIIGGISSIAWINWYFFLARQPVSNAGIDGEESRRLPLWLKAAITQPS